MINKVTRITIVVRDQDETLRWYKEKLGFEKRADNIMGPAMRWLTVAPRKQRELEIVLASPKWYCGKGSEKLIGLGTTIVVDTDDCRADYEALSSDGVKFTDPPKEVPYGVSAVFQDLYGNPWNLLQLKED